MEEARRQRPWKAGTDLNGTGAGGGRAPPWPWGEVDPGHSGGSSPTTMGGAQPQPWRADLGAVAMGDLDPGQRSEREGICDAVVSSRGHLPSMLVAFFMDASRGEESRATNSYEYKGGGLNIVHKVEQMTQMLPGIGARFHKPIPRPSKQWN